MQCQFLYRIYFVLLQCMLIGDKINVYNLLM